MIIKSILPANRVGALVLLFTLIFSTSHLKGATTAACTLTPMRSTNNVGVMHSVTFLLTTNGTAAGGVPVEFGITSGPNMGLFQSSTTSESGSTNFNYSSGGPGTDIIRASGTVDGVNFSCLATQVWIAAVGAPTIQCPPNIVTNTVGASCSRSVAFSAVSSGSPMPTTRCRIGSDVITSPHSFPAGVTTVTCTASNVNGVGTCTFTVTVNETDPQPPQITCREDLFVTSVPGDNGAVVEYEAPTASDTCGDPVVVCVPPSGSVFPVGTSAVECTATDGAGNTANCTFNVTVEEMQFDTHDMAVVRIRAPRLVTLRAGQSLTKRVVVTVQNRSPHTESFFDAAQLENLVTLTVQSFDANICADVVALPLNRPPQRRLPFNLRPRQKLNVYFEVTFDCAVNSARGPGSEDFFYTATVNHTAIDGAADTHPECDVCPRPPLDGLIDPNPNGRLRDRGCGAPTGGGNFGGEVLTDIFVR